MVFLFEQLEETFSNLLLHISPLKYTCFLFSRRTCAEKTTAKSSKFLEPGTTTWHFFYKDNFIRIKALIYTPLFAYIRHSSFTFLLHEHWNRSFFLSDFLLYSYFDFWYYISFLIFWKIKKKKSGENKNNIP